MTYDELIAIFRIVARQEMENGQLREMIAERDREIRRLQQQLPKDEDEAPSPSGVEQSSGDEAKDEDDAPEE